LQASLGMGQQMSCHGSNMMYGQVKRVALIAPEFGGHLQGLRNEWR
jgi:hypothetical protein